MASIIGGILGKALGGSIAAQAFGKVVGGNIVGKATQSNGLGNLLKAVGVVQNVAGGIDGSGLLPGEGGEAPSAADAVSDTAVETASDAAGDAAANVAGGAASASNSLVPVRGNPTLDAIRKVMQPVVGEITKPSPLEQAQGPFAGASPSDVTSQNAPSAASRGPTAVSFGQKVAAFNPFGGRTPVEAITHLLATPFRGFQNLKNLEGNVELANMIQRSAIDQLDASTGGTPSTVSDATLKRELPGLAQDGSLNDALTQPNLTIDMLREAATPELQQQLLSSGDSPFNITGGIRSDFAEAFGPGAEESLGGFSPMERAISSTTGRPFALNALLNTDRERLAFRHQLSPTTGAPAFSDAEAAAALDVRQAGVNQTKLDVNTQTQDRTDARQITTEEGLAARDETGDFQVLAADIGTGVPMHDSRFPTNKAFETKADANAYVKKMRAEFGDVANFTVAKLGQPGTAGSGTSGARAESSRREKQIADVRRQFEEGAANLAGASMAFNAARGTTSRDVARADAVIGHHEAASSALGRSDAARDVNIPFVGEVLARYGELRSPTPGAVLEAGRTKAAVAAVAKLNNRTIAQEAGAAVSAQEFERQKEVLILGRDSIEVKLGKGLRLFADLNMTQARLALYISVLEDNPDANIGSITPSDVIENVIAEYDVAALAILKETEGLPDTERPTPAELEAEAVRRAEGAMGLSDGAIRLLLNDPSHGWYFDNTRSEAPQWQTLMQATQDSR